jgi:hypothetical protein
MITFPCSGHAAAEAAFDAAADQARAAGYVLTETWAASHGYAELAFWRDDAERHRVADGDEPAAGPVVVLRWTWHLAPDNAPELGG